MKDYEDTERNSFGRLAAFAAFYQFIWRNGQLWFFLWGNADTGHFFHLFDMRVFPV